MDRPLPRRIASIASALVLIGAPHAYAVNPKPPVAAPVAAAVWTIDKAASRLTFRVAVGDQSFDGVFKSWDAQIAFDPNNLKASRAVVTVALASAMTGDPMRDQHLPRADGFDVAHFPKATFESSAITQPSPGHYLAAGELMVHGIKRRVELPFTLAIIRDVARMDGSMMLQSADFGIAHGDGAGEVTVKVKLTAHRAH